MEQVDNLIVGAGLSGAVIARRIAEEWNQPVLVIDSKSHIAGNSYDEKDPDTGIMLHKYGSHIFHTNNAEVWRFVNRFARFNTYMHKVIALIDGIETTIPFNLRTLFDVFPPSLAQRLEHKLLANFDYNSKVPILEFTKALTAGKAPDPDLKFLANYVYEKVFLHYTVKQWGLNPQEINGAVSARVPVFVGCDCRYFQNVYQGIPLGGYTAMVADMLDHPNIHVQLNTVFDKSAHRYKRLFYTGPIDEFFDFKFDALPYRSLHFEWEHHPYPYYQAGAVVNYPCNYDFTRIHECKYYLNDQSPRTVIAKEYPQPFIQGKNERYYPVPSDNTATCYNKYAQLAQQLPNTWFLGRLGDYKYYDMDQAVARALQLFSQINPEQ